MKKSEMFIDFIRQFDEKPFLIKMEEDYLIGKGEPAFTVKVNKPIDAKELMKSTSIALGEAYMRKDIEIEGDLYIALDNFMGQLGNFFTDTKALKKLMFTSKSKNNQKKEVSSHYDIGNDFYRLWLDETMNYSCAYFKRNSDTLYEAQMNKIHRILDKLALEEGMSLLDIGCGWGSVLIEAAKLYKVRGVGITLSEEQYKKVNERIEKEGLQDYLTVKLMDYRDLVKSKESFDRVVSIGMIEHVGRDNYNLFMSCVDKVLKPSGVFLLHYISGKTEKPGDAWMRKYIFPGGMLPSLREIISLCAEYDFSVLDVESLRRHYRETLLRWDRNFNEHREEIQEKMGEEFTRMWDLYLCACAASFNNGVIDLHQILMTKGTNNELPMLRWY